MLITLTLHRVSLKQYVTFGSFVLEFACLKFRTKLISF